MVNPVGCAGSMVSCAVLQLHGLDCWNSRRQVDGEISRAVKFARKESITGRDNVSSGLIKGRIYIFSDADAYGSGRNFAKFLKDNEMCDDITELGPWRNPNSGNQIRVWTFRYNGKVPRNFVVQDQFMDASDDAA